jgi:hypothetical protein
VQKTGAVLDTMVAGAVTGAARGLADEPAAVPVRTGETTRPAPATLSEGPRTTAVLSAMAPGAPLGAVSGVAKTVLPAEPVQRRAKKPSQR